MSDGSPMPRGLYTGPALPDFVALLKWSLRQSAKYAMCLMIAGTFVASAISGAEPRVVVEGIVLAIEVLLYGGLVGLCFLAHNAEEPNLFPVLMLGAHGCYGMWSVPLPRRDVTPSS